MSLNQFDYEKKTCFYHPSKESEPTIQCLKCKRYFCPDDLQAVTGKKLRSKYCPICYTKKVTSKFYRKAVQFVSVALVLGPVLDIGVLYLIIKYSLENKMNNSFLLILAEPLFIFVSILLLKGTLLEYRRILQVEFKTFLFLQSLSEDKNRFINDYESKLARKFASQDQNMVQ